MTLHTTPYAEIHYFPEKELIEQRFLPATINMKIDDFKQEMETFAAYCIKNKVPFHLIDTKQLAFTIEPKVQEWMNTEIFPRFEGISKKVAFLIPSDLFAQVSIEQTMSEEESKKYQSAFFDEKTEALKWLGVE